MSSLRGSLQWYSASVQFGLMAGPIAGGYFLQHFGFAAAFYSCSLIPLLGLLLVSTRMHAISSKPATPDKSNNHPWKWLSHKGALASLLIQIVVAVGSSSVSTFIPLYVRDYSITEMEAGMIITVCYISSALFRIPSGALADKFGNAPMILIGAIISAIGIAMIPSFHVLYQLAIVAFVFGLGMGICMPSALSWLAQLTPADKRGMAMGLGSATFQIGLALGATMLGITLQYSSFTTMYHSAAGVIGAGVIIIALLFKFGKSP